MSPNHENVRYLLASSIPLGKFRLWQIYGPARDALDLFRIVYPSPVVLPSRWRSLPVCACRAGANVLHAPVCALLWRAEMQCAAQAGRRGRSGGRIVLTRETD